MDEQTFNSFVDLVNQDIVKYTRLQLDSARHKAIAIIDSYVNTVCPDFNQERKIEATKWLGLALLEGLNINASFEDKLIEKSIGRGALVKKWESNSGSKSGDLTALLKSVPNVSTILFRGNGKCGESAVSYFVGAN